MAPVHNLYSLQESNEDLDVVDEIIENEVQLREQEKRNMEQRVQKTIHQKRTFYLTNGIMTALAQNFVCAVILYQLCNDPQYY